MRTYTLNGIKSKDEEKGTHRFAVVAALEVIKQGTAGQIIAQVKKARSLKKSKMDISKAIHWMIAKMFNAKELKGQKAPKAEAKKAAPKKAVRKAKKAKSAPQAPVTGASSKAA